MKVHHVIPRIHEEASGTTYVVPRLCEALYADGIDLCLHVLRSDPDKRYPFPLMIHPIPKLIERYGFSAAIKRALDQAAAAGAILHNHGLWMMPNVYAGLARKRHSCKLVTSPHGSLARTSLSRSSWKKGLMWRLGQSEALDCADCIHVTSLKELNEIRDLDYRAPIALIANGVESHAARLIPRPHESALRTCLFLSRIHPTKGLELLLQVWRGMENKHPNWRLKVVGPGDASYVDRIRKLVAALGCCRVELDGPVYGDRKREIMEEADLFVLPTFSENFGICVAEALLAQVPVIVTKGAPWSRVSEHRCGWWVERTEEDLAVALNSAMSMDAEDRNEMGRRGRSWIEREFSFESMSRKLIGVYRWLDGQEEMPECVELGVGKSGHTSYSFARAKGIK